MAALTVQVIGDTGAAPNFAAPTTSDTARIGTGLDTFVVYKNTDASPHTVTLLVPGNEPWGAPTADNVVTVPATNGQVWLMLRRFYDDGTGSATLTLDAVTGVEVALVRVG